MGEQPDLSEPTIERQAELVEGYSRNLSASSFRERVFAIRTRGELEWLIRRNGWSGEIDDSLQNHRIELCSVNFRRANLRGIHLYQAKLQDSFFKEADLRNALLIGAHLLDASFEFANLEGAHLVGAYSPHANMNNANLRRANLCGACLAGCGLSEADLRDAELFGADLKGTNLSGADLRGANLTACQLDDRTMVENILVDAETRWIHGPPY